MTFQESLSKLERYCAYQDRCHSEVKKKMREIGTYREDQDELLVRLIQDGFLNEERYARSFVRGKFRMKLWGRNKIRQALRMKQVHDRLVDQALAEEIDEGEYMEAARKVLEKKERELSKLPDFERGQKLRKFLLSRGYEGDVLRELFSRD